MAMKPTTPKRRTFAEIASLSHAEVKAELISVGLKPLELVPYVEHSSAGPDPRPRLEPHQRYDYTEYDALNDDPFAVEYKKNYRPVPNPFDAVTSDHFTLYGYELGRYVDVLPMSTITKKLETFRKDHRLSSTPQRTWGDPDYRREMWARLSHADHEAFIAASDGIMAARKIKKARST